MNSYSPATRPMPGARKHFGRNTVLATLGGGFILAAAVATGFWARSGNDESPASSVEAVTAPPSFGGAVHYTSDTSTPRQIYVVGSEEQADLIWAGINDASAIRAALGEGPLAESVMVVGSDEEAAAFIDSINEGNRILASLGVAEDLVTDLRGK